MNPMPKNQQSIQTERSISIFIVQRKRIYCGAQQISETPALLPLISFNISKLSIYLFNTPTLIQEIAVGDQLE